MPKRRLRIMLAAVFVLGSIITAACGSASPEEVAVPTNAEGFPIDWPIRLPPGSIADCSAGEVSRDDALFTVVFCLPATSEPSEISQTYLSELRQDGYIERDANQFAEEMMTFLDGNGIEIFYQLVPNTNPAQATIILIRPAG